tara:strand:- start:70 stop:810 length:741 start_codon:yes stop_codon:yes gene_type:complete
MSKATLKAQLERFPLLYLTLLKLKRTGHWSQRWIVSSETGITIEGFPRSGNSFARSAFMAAQPDEMCIATHVHSAAQVRQSVRLGIPTMVLLRNPADACLSLVALDYEIAGTQREDISTAEATATLIENLAAYYRFYRDTLTVYNSVVIADFSIVTTDYGEIIQRINRKCGTQFTTYQNSSKNDAALFDKGGFHLSPNENRNAIKSAIRSILQSAAVRPALDQAEQVYQAIQQREHTQYPKSTGSE